MFSSRGAPIGRECYRASGWANWLVFAPLGMMTLFVAAVMGVLLAVAYWSGFYWIGIAPLIAALPIAGMMHATVTASHCRNRAAGMLLGLLAAVVCYLGYFHVALLEHIGIQNIHRVDFLPRYIVWRMNTDIIQDVGKGDVNPPPAGPDAVKVAFNWVFFCMDAAILAGLSIAPAATQCLKPYSEERRRWMKSFPVILPTGSAAPLVEALQARNLPGLVQLLVDPPVMQAGYCEMTVFHPPAGDPGAPRGRLFASVAELGLPDKQTGVRPRKEVARLWELFDDEVAIAANRYSGLAAALGGPAASVTGSLQVLAATQPRQAAEDVFIDALPEHVRGKVLSRANLTIGAILALAPLLALFLFGIGLLALAAYWATTPPVAISIGLGIGGIGLLVAAALWGLWFGDFLPSRWLYGAMQRQIQMRSDAIVRPEQPGVEFIQVIPRAHWGKVMVENASDVGLLAIDRARQMLLFEGDHERWAIPAGSIVSCEVEHFVIGTDNNAAPFYLAVIRAQNGDAIWEGCINRRHIKFERRGAAKVAQHAAELRQQVLALRQAGAS